MCQAYDCEWALIVAEENRATMCGFAAAQFHSSKTENPYHQKSEMYSFDAWNHGWNCWQERMLPGALEKTYQLRGDYAGAQQARIYFEKTGKLLEELEKIVERYEQF